MLNQVQQDVRDNHRHSGLTPESVRDKEMLNQVQHDVRWGKLFFLAYY
jgi:hypothetical protein